MVLWPTIITGGVGVAGICGALLGTRWQTAAVKFSIAAEDDRAKVAEKRRIYAAASAALNDSLLAMAGQELSKNETDAAAFRSARVRASSAAWELQLIASADVSRHARDALAALIPAMRADLGVYPLDIGDLW